MGTISLAASLRHMTGWLMLDRVEVAEIGDLAPALNECLHREQPDV